MNNFCVYSYSDPREDLPRYIGKGLPHRPHQHLCDSNRLVRTTHFYCWLNKLLAEGLSPDIVIIASGLPEQAALDLEVSLIKKYGRRDIGTGCLCNHTDGGDGVSGGRWVITPKTLEQEINAKPRPRFSEETKQKLSAAAASRCRPVEKYSLITGEILEVFPSVKSVEKSGYSRKSVNAVLSGNSRSSAGYGWRYA